MLFRAFKTPFLENFKALNTSLQQMNPYICDSHFRFKIMFSKEEAARLRKEFWTSYGKSFPRKWLLYNTKIKGFSFKFYADNKTAMVMLDIEPLSETKRELLYEQVAALKKVFLESYISEAIFDQHHYLDSGKLISRIYVRLEEKFSIYNKNTWGVAFDFFNKNMQQFELWFYEFEDFIKQADIK